MEAVFARLLSLLDRGQAPEQSPALNSGLHMGTGPPWPGESSPSLAGPRHTSPDMRLDAYRCLLMPSETVRDPKASPFSPYHNFRGEEK